MQLAAGESTAHEIAHSIEKRQFQQCYTVDDG
jgi:hypothetical protein